MRENFLPFHTPEIETEEIDAVVQTLRSGWLTSGPRVKEFEAAFAAYVGAAHAVAVNSGTAALHLALDAIGIEEGDEVIVPTMTFAATAEVVRYFKAWPRLVDCCPDTLNIDPKTIEAAVTPRTKAIIPVHFGGYPYEVEEIHKIAERHGLRIVDDAAHALPCRYHARVVGTLADITCFSFYATKSITTGEGGMITTSNKEYADRMRLMSLHGISSDAWKRYTAEGSWYYEILGPGYKYNLTDIAASMGIEQLKKCDRFWEARRRIAGQYNDSFADLAEITLPEDSHAVQHAWHLYVIRLNQEHSGIERREFVDRLTEEKIGTSVHFIPLHLHPYYRDTLGYKPEDFPHATAAYERIVSLPIYSKMTDDDVRDVVRTVRKVFESSRR